MPWITLVDATLWGITLAASLFLARAVYRRRDLPARLFLFMVVALAIPQIHYTLGLLIAFFAWLFPGASGQGAPEWIYNLWPVDIAAVVAFGCLTLHLFLIFPTESRVIRRWRSSPLLFYLPGALLIVMMLSHLALGPERYTTFWGLERLGLLPATPQILFVILTVGAALVRLLIIYSSRATPRIRRQLAWPLWGLVLGGGLVLLIDYGPSLAGLPPLVAIVPGVRQLPILILLGTFAISMQRHHIFDVNLVISRSLAYSIVVIVIAILYLALGTALGVLFQTASGSSSSPFILTILTTLIVVFVALPLRDTIQHLVDRFFLRRRASYRRLLQDFSRTLTTPVALPRLLVLVADQVTEVSHPAGLAMVLNGGSSGYQVVLSQGILASQPMWQEGARFATDHFVPAQMAARHRPLYLPWHTRDDAAQQGPSWLEVDTAGVRLLIPMHLRGSLIGWIALGPRLSDLSYSQQDLEFLGALADQACVALDNARLYDEMQRRATELAMVAMVSSAISSSLDLERVLQTIVESVTQVVNCEKSAIFELSEDGNHLSLRMSKGLSPAYQSGSQHLDVSSNRALAISTRQPFIVPDIRAEPRLAKGEEMAQQEEYRAVVDLPLVGREGILGILSVYFDEVHSPTADELEVLTTFASQATIAIENARLYATATRERDRARRLYQQTDAALAQRVEELTAIEEISRRLTGTLDLQQVMNLVLDQSLQATQADRGIISLYNREKRSLQLLSQTGYPEAMERYRTEPWPDDRGITGRVARSGQPALVPDVSQDPDYVSGIATTRSQISVPIAHEGRVIGIITLESDRLAAFTPEHLRFAGLLADHAAIGINNAQLFQQMMEGRDRLQAILNSTQDGVIVFDTAGYMILVNPRVREMLGPEAERWLLSNSLLEEFQAPDSPLFQLTDLSLEHIAKLRTQVLNRPDQAVEVAFSFQSGSERLFLEATASPVPSEAGEVLGWVAVLRDMTRQQELEQFREDLTSMVIHNLQGPLAVIISSLETLSEFLETDPATARELLHITQQSAQNLYGRIESVLWLRRLEDSQLPLNLKSLPLPMVAQPVMDEYAPLAASVGVSLEASYGQDLPPVLVDEEVIGRVFSNLLDNALKFTPPGGKIRLHATLQNNAEEWQLLCAVTDTGPGIPEEARGVIFGKFRRGDQAALGRRRGMGIGLHYCRLAVETHGGQIWVESRTGEGSTFCFTLPADHKAA